jgi:hypothetical protein
MVRDDLLIGSLRIPIREMQELVNYLESRRGLNGDDIAYCRHRVTELMRQQEPPTVWQHGCVASATAVNARSDDAGVPRRRYIKEERRGRRCCAAATRRDGPIRCGGHRCSSLAYRRFGTRRSSRLARLASGSVATMLPYCWGLQALQHIVDIELRAAGAQDPLRWN